MVEFMVNDKDNERSHMKGFGGDVVGVVIVVGSFITIIIATIITTTANWCFSQKDYIDRLL